MKNIDPQKLLKTYLEEGKSLSETGDLFGVNPQMIYSKSEYTRASRRFINLYYYRSYTTIAEAWKNYKYRKLQGIR